MGWTTGVWFPAGAGIIFLFTTASRLDMGPTQPPIQWVPGIKQTGCEADHSLPSSSKIKNVWSYSLNPPLHHTPLRRGATLSQVVTYLWGTAYTAWCESARGLFWWWVPSLWEATVISAVLLPATVTLLSDLHNSIPTDGSLWFWNPKYFINTQFKHTRCSGSHNSDLLFKLLNNAVSSVNVM